MLSNQESRSALKQEIVSKQQLKEATTRQRIHGGRLGENLMALGYITEEQLDSFFFRTPPEPETVKDTGLDLDYIADLALKHAYGMGKFRLSDLSKRMGLSTNILDEAIELLRSEKLIEVRGASQFTKTSFDFIITGIGKKRAGELMEICRYAGPAPVTLHDYRVMVENQSIHNIDIDEEVVKATFSDLVISDYMLKRLGPAVNSGAPMFLYGPPGNGKTTIAEKVGQILPETIFVPHSIFVGGQIVAVFDPVNHSVVEDLPTDDDAAEDYDRRWVRIQRPIIMTGGELTLRMLDLEFNTIAKFYEAPLQMKANNGLFIIDDFGRQQMDPQSLLNRWIINLDRRIDFMSMHTGMKFEIPFDQLVIFATNLEPKSLVDEAFLRRIRYKIKIEQPTDAEFLDIFRQVCEMNNVTFNEEAYSHLIEHWYRRHNLSLSGCHPRDLVGHITDMARYFDDEPVMTRDTIDQACENYFVEP